MQEAYARWYAMTGEQRQAIGSPGAWLARVTGRVCLDLLGSARVRRERYVGNDSQNRCPAAQSGLACRPGPPGATPADRVTLDESLSMAFLVVLDSMAPAERVAFVLASSARLRVQAARPPAGPGARQANIVRDFKQAWEAGDIGALIQLLDPDAVLTADGGGLAMARYAFAITDRTARVTILECSVNGQPGLVVQQAGATVTVLAFTVAGDRITRIWAVRNPDKLRSRQGGCPGHGEREPGERRVRTQAMSLAATRPATPQPDRHSSTQHRRHAHPRPDRVARPRTLRQVVPATTRQLARPRHAA